MLRPYLAVLGPVESRPNDSCCCHSVGDVLNHRRGVPTISVASRFKSAPANKRFPSKEVDSDFVTIRGQVLTLDGQGASISRRERKVDATRVKPGESIGIGDVVVEVPKPRARGRR
jgi:hypothetical protein